jgi:hypothetical protein
MTLSGLLFKEIPKPGATLAAETAASAASVVENFMKPVPLGLLHRQYKTVGINESAK